MKNEPIKDRFGAELRIIKHHLTHTMLNEFDAAFSLNKYPVDPEIKEDDLVLCYHDNQVLLKKTGENLELPARRDFEAPIATAVYLFSMNSIHYFGVQGMPQKSEELEFYDIFVLRSLPNKQSAWIASLGYQLINWLSQNRFCGRCGSETVLRKEERAVYCPECSLIVYPKISPAVIVAITCNDKILLAKGKNYKGDFYALIAGYVDAGESIEETVVREVKEEVGLDIRNLKYYKSQPWPFSSSLMLGFTAEADDTKPIVIDDNEIKDAGWFTRGKLPPHASGISISGDLIEAFEKGLF